MPLMFMHECVTILTQNKAIGAPTASDVMWFKKTSPLKGYVDLDRGELVYKFQSGGGRAPLASFWVTSMTSCINIKRGI